MVSEPWILKLGNQVSSNLKHGLPLEKSKKLLNKKQGQQEKQIIGILSFEVANVMSKIIHLHKSLSDNEIVYLKNEILKSEGIRILVSNDDTQLIELALVEKIDELNRVASVVSRLGKKCTVPALLGFEHVYGDIVSGAIDVKELGILVKNMDSMVSKMERYVKSTASLYSEMEVMNELEMATKKFQQNQLEESRKAFEQKLMWHKQDVSHLKDISLWNQSYDKVVELLARTVSTIHARIYMVFGDALLRGYTSSVSASRSHVGFSRSSQRVKKEFGKNLGQLDVKSEVQMGASFTKSVSTKSNGYYHSGSIQKGMLEKRTVYYRPRDGMQKSEGGLFGPEDFNFACGIGPGRLFMECLTLSSSASKVDDDDDDDNDYVSCDDRSSQISGCYSDASGMTRDRPNLSGFYSRSQNGDSFSGDRRHIKFGMINGERFGLKSRLLAYAPPNTVGGSALALHYANVIIVIEKLLCYPHLVGQEARDDLYQMLPTSLRKTLKTNLKSYVKDMTFYDAPLAHEWRERLDEMLTWLAQLAHNMIRWQSECNFEQQQIVSRTNVLLLQTLYFADLEKTEAAICQLLVGLNYICGYEHQQNALLDCASSFDNEDSMEWQLQINTSFHP